MRAGKRQSHPNYRAMGFLSRKKKPEPVVEDTHPLEEELKGMEEAVPEAQYVDSDGGAPAAGPVAEEASVQHDAGPEAPETEEPSYEAPAWEAPLTGAPRPEQAASAPAPPAPPAPAPQARPEVAVNASPAND